MKIAATIAEVRASSRRSPRVFVPTMGALHDGHLQLVSHARKVAGATGEVAVSIFVNPLQFEPGSDYERYPRVAERDQELCREAGVDLLFYPSAEEMYSPDRSISVEETSLSQRLCGRSRPGHFRGVCTVVAKLFNIVQPDVAVFGAKDFQQLAIIRRMVRDLNFPVAIAGVPTVREPDGLAMSSRNQYLTREERSQAPTLGKALQSAAELASGGERSAPLLIERVCEIVRQAPLARLDYVELVDRETLQPLEVAERGSVLAIAAFFGQTRLIDNIQLP